MASDVSTSQGAFSELPEKAFAQLDAEQLKELQSQKAELLSRVAALRKDLSDWRTNLDAQVKSYKSEIGELRATIQSEMDTLKTDFLELKGSLYEQLRVTAELAEVGKSA